MPRIRTIKPEFWTSAQVLECSTNARLLFIGLWNFSDDQGRHSYKAKQIKAEVFPADDFTEQDILGMLSELESNGLIVKYVVDDKEYFYIPGWGNQRIDKPQDPKHPAPPQEHSKNVPGTLPPERKGGKGKEGGKKRRLPESEQDVIAYFRSHGYSTESAKRFFHGYSEADWHDTQGNPILNWKQKAQNVWFKPDNKKSRDENSALAGAK